MKKIEAIIKSMKLHEVLEELDTIDGLTGLTVYEVKGFGRELVKDKPIHIVDNSKNWEPHVKIEIFCTNEIAALVIKTIQQNAHTGLRGDGKIYLIDVEKSIRISTGEEGSKAI